MRPRGNNREPIRWQGRRKLSNKTAHQYARQYGYELYLECTITPKDVKQFSEGAITKRVLDKANFDKLKPDNTASPPFLSIIESKTNIAFFKLLKTAKKKAGYPGTLFFYLLFVLAFEVSGWVPATIFRVWGYAGIFLIMGGLMQNADKQYRQGLESGIKAQLHYNNDLDYTEVEDEVISEVKRNVKQLKHWYNKNKA